jgi:hypothetical protein
MNKFIEEKTFEIIRKATMKNISYKYDIEKMMSILQNHGK